RGYEYYDLRHDVVNTTFVNYEDNATRKTGALSYLMYTSFGVSSNNTVERVEFIDAKPVYFPPMERKWANDNGNSTAWKTAVIRDLDGSLGGGPDSYVLIHDGVNDSIATDAEACEIKSAWNAAVCTGDVGRLNVGGGGGFGGFFGGGPGGPGGPGAAAGRGGPAGPGAAAGRGGPAPGAAGPGGPGAPGGPAVAAGRGGPGGPAGPGAAPGRRGAGAFGGAPAAAQPPVVLSRNGKDYTLTSTNVRAGTEIKVTTERPEVSLTLTELDAGSWVIFELPGFTTAASGAPQDSLDALREASGTSYYQGTDALWVKVVSNGGPGRAATSLQ